MSEEKLRTRKKKTVDRKNRKQLEKRPLLGNLLVHLKTRNKPLNTAQAEDETVAGTGTVVLSKAVLLGRILAWTLVVFVITGSGIGFAQLLNPPAQAQQINEPTDDSAAQQAGDYARGFVGAWLRATRDDAAVLSRYKTISRGEITAKEATEFRDLSVASVELEGKDTSTVIISAEVLTAPDSEGQVIEGESPKSVWAPSWFQVNIQHDNDQFMALGWPAPIPTPQTASAPQLTYGYAGSEDVKETLEAFFQAYALGEGDVRRMTHPEATIQPLGPNPYTTVKISNITTDMDFEEALPPDGTTTRVLVELFLGTSEDAARAATYALTLETRGGRWEVRALDAAPVLNSTKTKSTPPENQVSE